MTTTLARDAYGALYTTDYLARPAALICADALVKDARRKLPTIYNNITRDRKGRFAGSARHADIYDVNPTGTRALICLRSTEGSKYGVRTTDKTYVVLARHGRGVRVLQANKAVAAKAAKAAGAALGVAIDTALGKCKLAAPKSAAPRIGYKLVARTENGFKSVWDGSLWTIGVTRVEQATDDHTGGYYYYAALAECLAAAATNEVFGEHRAAHRLAIIEVEAAGRHYAHLGECGIKLCATRVTPLREIASTL